MTTVDEAQLRAENSGLWFSPQTPEPRVLGQRGLDSVLFDLRKLDPATAREIRRRTAAHRVAPGSGLIDIKVLVAAEEEVGPPPQLEVPRRASLLDVAAMPLGVPAAAAATLPSAKPQPRWLVPVLGLLTLLAVALALVAVL